MADETIAGNVGESVAIDAKITPPAVKNTRGPRRPKAAVEAVATAAAAHAAAEKPAKKPRARRGSVVTAKDTKVAVKAPRSKQTGAKIVTAMEPLDDIADLIKLEEENKRLRKELSDRLRAENADLRKRLGHT